MLNDLISYISGAGLATPGTNMFRGYLPTSPVDAVALYETGGPQPNKEISLKKKTFQITIRSSTYQIGVTKLANLRSLLQGKSQVQIGGTFFLYILAVSEGGHLGRDDNGADLFSINFICETR
jgi:hypothetical protein